MVPKVSWDSQLHPWSSGKRNFGYVVTQFIHCPLTLTLASWRPLLLAPSSNSAVTYPALHSNSAGSLLLASISLLSALLIIVELIAGITENSDWAIISVSRRCATFESAASPSSSRFARRMRLSSSSPLPDTSPTPSSPTPSSNKPLLGESWW